MEVGSKVRTATEGEIREAESERGTGRWGSCRSAGTTRRTTGGAGCEAVMTIAVEVRAAKRRPGVDGNGWTIAQP